MKAISRISCSRALLRLVTQGLDVLEVVEDLLTGLPLLVVEVPHRHVVLDLHLVLLPGGVDVVLALQLLGDGLLQQPAALGHDRAELVANRLIHGAVSLCLAFRLQITVPDLSVPEAIESRIIRASEHN